MEKHLFLTGEKGVGKSELIKSVLGDKLGYAGGYVTYGEKDTDGALLGVNLIPAAAFAGISGYESARILTQKGGKMTSDNEVFRAEGVRLLKESEYYPFTVLDEFGGFELIIPQFREALLEVLNSDMPCIGVLMTEREGEALRSALGLGEKYSAYRRALHTALENDPDTRIIKLTGTDDINARNALSQWANEYARL